MRLLRVTIIPAIAILVACGGTARKEPETSHEPDQFESYRAYDHFVKGDLYEQSGNYDAAAEEYRKALIFDPKSAEIRRSLSEVYFQQKKFDEAAILRSEIADKTTDDYNFIADCLRFMKDLESAASFYKRSLDLDSLQFMPRLYLAKIYAYLGKNREAEQQLLALIKVAPDRAEAYMELAEFYLDQKNLVGAFDAYQQAARSDSGDIRPVIGMAGVYLARGDTVNADSLYYDVARRNWDDIEFLSSIIISFYAIHRYDRAEEIAARIVELAPGEISAQRRYAMILFGNQKFSKAESLMTEIENHGGADAALYYYLARIKQDQKKYPKAEDYFRKSLALADTLIDSWINLAMVIDEQNRYPEALSVMAKAMARLPEDSTAILFYTALIHSRNEQFELARAGYERLLKSNPDDISFRFNHGAACERMEDYEEAEKEFRWIIEKEPRNALALNYLGYMFADRGVSLKESRELIERALEIEPANGAFLDSYAWVLYKLGKYDEALTQMNKAIESDNGDPVVYDHQGDIYSALNQKELARQSWAKALELKPDDEAIRAKLNAK